MTDSLVALKAAESTCLKRVTVCVIYDEAGIVLAAESNRCSPPNGVCTRLGITAGRESYPSNSECNWMHAERRAVDALHPGARPFVAVIHGHDFACADCDAALRSAGVLEVHIVPEGNGTGVLACG